MATSDPFLLLDEVLLMKLLALTGQEFLAVLSVFQITRCISSGHAPVESLELLYDQQYHQPDKRYQSVDVRSRQGE
jgi:hypothetical protein